MPRIDSRYLISNQGRVRGPHGRILKPTLLRIGYYSVAISSKSNGVTRYYVHRLVAEVFVGELAAGFVVNHVNHDKLDNRADNLEIIPRSFNGAHWATLKRSPKVKKTSGERCGRGHLFHQTKQGRKYCKQCRELRRSGNHPSPPADTEWRAASLEGYLVSADGRVWSLLTRRVLRHGINRPGYCYVCLRVDGKTKPTAIHRLVAVSFLGNLSYTAVVDHINGDKRDNRVANLRIVSRADNMRAFRDGIRVTGRHGFKFDEALVARVKQDLAAGLLTKKAVAEKHGISVSHVYNIASGTQWSHVEPELKSGS
jgi:hypothetical protein